MKQYIAPLLRLGTVAALLVTLYKQNEIIAEYKTSDNLAKDSLQAELFIQQTINGRYETALDQFKSEDSVAADHFEYILNNKTE